MKWINIITYLLITFIQLNNSFTKYSLTNRANKSLLSLGLNNDDDDGSSEPKVPISINQYNSNINKLLIYPSLAVSLTLTLLSDRSANAATSTTTTITATDRVRGYEAACSPFSPGQPSFTNTSISI